MSQEFHARAIYHHRTNTAEQVTLVVYSTGDPNHSFELHRSTDSEPTRGRKGQIITDWRRENQRLQDNDFQRDNLQLADQDFEL